MGRSGILYLYFSHHACHLHAACRFHGLQPCCIRTLIFILLHFCTWFSLHCVTYRFDTPGHAATTCACTTPACRAWTPLRVLGLACTTPPPACTCTALGQFLLCLLTPARHMAFPACTHTHTRHHRCRHTACYLPHLHTACTITALPGLLRFTTCRLPAPDVPWLFTIPPAFYGFMPPFSMLPAATGCTRT